MKAWKYKMKGSFKMNHRFGVSAVALLSAFTAMSASGAMAQTAPPADELVLEEIIVTGSRIARPAERSPVPVTTLQAADLQTRGITNVADAISRVPALVSTPSVAETTNGRVTANLRGLGANRTLVLVNGRRHVSGVQGEASVDLSTIPSALVDRVDVLTGGASAVYGSDAVTGVINFVLKRDFDGQEVSAQINLPEDGEGMRSYAAATIGRNFDNDRGNVMLSVTGFKQDRLRFGDRDFTRGNGIDDDVANPALFVQEADLTPALRTAGVTAGTRILSMTAAQQMAAGQTLVDRARNAVGRVFVQDPRFAGSSVYGIIGFAPTGGRFPATGTSSNAPNIDLDNNGTRDCLQSRPGRGGFGCLVVDPTTGRLRPFQDGALLANNDQSGGDGTPDFLDRATVVPEVETYTADLVVRYEVNSYFKPFLEAKAVRNKALNIESIRTFDDSIPIRYDNPFVPDALRAIADAQIAANPSLSRDTYRFIITRDHADVVDPNVTSERDTYRIVGGFEGEFENGWTYELAYNWGRTDSEDTRPNRLNDRFFAAIDAVRAPNGQIVCRSSINPTAVPLVADFPVFTWTGFNTFSPTDGSCRPLNLFGLGAPSADAQAFVTTPNTRTSTIEQRVASAVLTGDTSGFFELPAGPIDFAFGAEYREEESDYRTSDFEQRGFTDRGGEQPVNGGFDVTEAFIESTVPLVAGVPGVEYLAVDGAYRYGDYSTVGTVSAWKVGSVYSPVEGFRVRGGYSSTVRAPNIFELYQPRSSALFTVLDPCDASQIGIGPNPANRRANCAADGIPTGWLDPRTARVPGFTGGNLGLTEETSKSYTVGAVITPALVDGLSIAVDYWNIEIDDAIANVAAQDVLNACYDAANLNNAFCGQFSRNRTTGASTFLGLSSLNQTRVNFARFEAAGIDFEANYSLDLEMVGLADVGGLDFSVTGTWLQKNRSFQSATNSSLVNNALGERFVPRWAVNPSVSWSYETISVSWYGTWQSRQTLPGVEVETAGNFQPAFAEATWVHDAAISWDPTEELTFTLGVNNITYEKPFVNELNRPASALGRSYYLRMNARF
ncbi:MAG: hypothetical protein RLY86_2732 [Pseudomonadota bacterium]|jgi:outer membrane receptor protein involved in Fe transport